MQIRLLCSVELLLFCLEFSTSCLWGVVCCFHWIYLLSFLLQSIPCAQSSHSSQSKCIILWLYRKKPVTVCGHRKVDLPSFYNTHLIPIHSVTFCHYFTNTFCLAFSSLLRVPATHHIHDTFYGLSIWVWGYVFFLMPIFHSVEFSYNFYMIFNFGLTFI